MATEQAPTCKATASIGIGRFTEADVECGKEPHGTEEAHVASQDATTAEGKYARIAFIWN